MTRTTKSDQKTSGSAERLRIEFWPLDRRIPSARNARTHSDAQVAEIAGSIRAFGFTNPVLVGEEGEVRRLRRLDGRGRGPRDHRGGGHLHGRHLAAGTA